MLSAGQQTAVAAISREKERFTALSDKIWELAELSLKEHASAAVYRELLGELGFTVESGLGGLPTAFSGTYGSGSPVIGVLGEFDALSGLSQVGGAVRREPLQPGGSGHGCGHNMLGAGALAAAYGIKCYLEESGRSGTVIFFGCPGEEGGAAKALLAREGLWRRLDAAITWHPGDVNEVRTGTCNSSLQTLFKFHGTSAHAAGDPEHGRSALDAVELMNTGVQYLREHMKSDARVHYAILNAGGLSPNVVQAEASVLYMTRSIEPADMLALQRRVEKIADGAALMTETTAERVFIDGTANTLTNHALEQLTYDCMQELPLPEYTAEEWAYAKAVKETITERAPLGIAAEHDPEVAARLEAYTDGGRRAINDYLVPLWKGWHFEAGSTDVGDVSWLTPTVQVYAACFVAGSPGHSWQNVSCGKTGIGHKGMLYAAGAMAATGVALFEQPAALADIRAEFEKRSAAGYVCPIPEGESIKIIE